MASDPPFDDRFVAGEEIRERASAVLWAVRRDAHVSICCLAVGPLSAALQILVDGQVVVEHTFASPAEATVFAAGHRTDLLSQGWVPVDEALPLTHDPTQES